MGVSQQHVDGVVCHSKADCKHCEFHTWYKKQTGEYNFKNELVTYCKSDVDILAEGLQVYIKDCLEEHGIHPLASVTAASYAMKCYTTNTCPTLEEIDEFEGHESEVSPVLPGLKPYTEMAGDCEAYAEARGGKRMDIREYATFLGMYQKKGMDKVPQLSPLTVFTMDEFKTIKQAFSGGRTRQLEG